MLALPALRKELHQQRRRDEHSVQQSRDLALGLVRVWNWHLVREHLVPGVMVTVGELDLVAKEEEAMVAVLQKILPDCSIRQAMGLDQMVPECCDWNWNWQMD